MAWIDPDDEARKHGYITDPALERMASRAILRGVPLEKIIERFGALPQGLIVIARSPESNVDADEDEDDDESAPPSTHQ